MPSSDDDDDDDESCKVREIYLARYPYWSWCLIRPQGTDSNDADIARIKL